MKLKNAVKMTLVTGVVSIGCYGVVMAQQQSSRAAREIPCDAQKAILMSSFQPRIATHELARDSEVNGLLDLLKPDELAALKSSPSPETIHQILDAVANRNFAKEDAKAFKMGALLGYVDDDSVAFTRNGKPHHIFQFASDAKVRVTNDPETPIDDEFWDLDVLLKGRVLPRTMILSDGLVVEGVTRLSVARMERVRDLLVGPSPDVSASPAPSPSGDIGIEADAKPVGGASSSHLTIRIESRGNAPIETRVASAEELVSRFLLPESCRVAKPPENQVSDGDSTPFSN